VAKTQSVAGEVDLSDCWSVTGTMHEAEERLEKALGSFVGRRFSISVVTG